MALVTGRLTGAHTGPMTRYSPRVYFILNKTTLHGGTIVVDQPVQAVVSGVNFSVEVEPTYTGEYYRVEVKYFDEDNRFVEVRELARELKVPEGGGDLGGSINAVLAPDTVVVSLEEPEMDWSFWLQAAPGNPDDGNSTGSGDLYMRKAR